jgi:hypothetical protein
MRWGRRATTGAALALALASRVGGVPPPSVPLGELPSRVGEIVTVEGDVAAAYTTAGTCVLEFEAANPKGFRAVLVIPMFTDLPRQPERLYAGRRVRVSGRVQRFQGRLEMVLRDPSQVEIVDVAGVPPPPSMATGPEPPPPAAPPAAVAPPPPAAVAPPPPAAGAPEPPPAPATPPLHAEPAAPSSPPVAAVTPPDVESPRATAPTPAETPAAAPPATTPPRTVVEAVERRLPLPDPCPKARAAWREAAARVAEANAALGRCLAAETYRCRSEAMAMSPVLAQLEATEQHVEDDCP